MTAVDRIKKLAKDHNMSVYELEAELGFGRNTIYQWNKRTPSAERIRKVADYFEVSIDYIMGRSRNNDSHPEIDLANTKDVILTFEGKTIPTEDIELIKKLLRKNNN
ncbi:transcriptional regulator [Liquorilactobacillus sucicola DSM 21376 = JCM 15457]|uniref:HTH cro/C1-type domain-containing protein n=1 Tax=Liquorilactobacillus sucicola DSM 21376 = JCM 15457 TaxID=1423806 RepID=A0A023CU62_9LACO|nr:helix-turn-helix transcriptional regulator [Liquorilactobacillus sucicola]KRN05244.1 hypothetical protein FD15_GL001790 [Liquorilactobacillus sucicola DSM 21376 = JCM 15457]GAJ25304.1 transcriptional regulator [Liquorilactobacillus sucicola DSM 21376 = JCM 15457]